MFDTNINSINNSTHCVCHFQVNFQNLVVVVVIKGSKCLAKKIQMARIRKSIILKYQIYVHKFLIFGAYYYFLIDPTTFYCNFLKTNSLRLKAQFISRRCHKKLHSVLFSPQQLIMSVKISLELLFYYYLYLYSHHQMT